MGFYFYLSFGYVCLTMIIGHNWQIYISTCSDPKNFSYCIWQTGVFYWEQTLVESTWPLHIQEQSGVFFSSHNTSRSYVTILTFSKLTESEL